MKRVQVVADFDWLDSPKVVGELRSEFIRSADNYSFEFDKEWLKQYGGINLSRDLRNYSGVQYAPNHQLLGCLQDSLPDRWGRTLLFRREQILAKVENRPVNRLGPLDMLIQVDDFSRMGGLRFAVDGVFENASRDLAVPPLASLREIQNAVEHIEVAEEKNRLPAQRWIEQLFMPGSSLGGARPKSSVQDGDTLLIAKFPSRHDLYDVESWEHLCHLIAAKAGINVAKTRIMKFGKYHTMLSERFDRKDGRRVHFASAMTLLGLTDGDGADSGKGYLDIADFIMSECTSVLQNLEELYRRIAFNICIGNSDDHFRNHGFLLTSMGWTLSPAYDINPSLSRSQSLLINQNTNDADVNVLLDSCSDYMLKKSRASEIISEVKLAVAQWAGLASKMKIPRMEQEMFAQRFNE